jgi:hypothetical protein
MRSMIVLLLLTVAARAEDCDMQGCPPAWKSTRPPAAKEPGETHTYSPEVGVLDPGVIVPGPAPDWSKGEHDPPRPHRFKPPGDPPPAPAPAPAAIAPAPVPTQPPAFVAITPAPVPAPAPARTPALPPAIGAEARPATPAQRAEAIQEIARALRDALRDREAQETVDHALKKAETLDAAPAGPPAAGDPIILPIHKDVPTLR